MKCLLCHSIETVEFLNLGNQPLANKYPTSQAEFASENFFPLAVFYCTRCSNVQLGTVVSRERMFLDYYYLSSVNLGLVRHFEQLAKKISGAHFVLDIGSNDGILLSPLKKLGVKAIGLDPSVNVSKIANDAGLITIVSFFDSAAVQTIEKQYGKPDVIVASSIFTHLENPNQFIEDVKNLMTDDGEFIIEVEYIGEIIKKVQFERFYLDRVFYYSLKSLVYLFEAHGMYVSDIENIEPHGGSIRVTARKKRGSRTFLPDKVNRFLIEEKKKINLQVLRKFKEEVDDHINAFREKLKEYKDLGLKVAGYGAPARVATITNHGKIGPGFIEFIVDDSPLKQGRFSPGQHIPIVPQDFLKNHRPDILIVFAYEYLEDIKKKTDHSYRYLIAIPPREV